MDSMELLIKEEPGTELLPAESIEQEDPLAMDPIFQSVMLEPQSTIGFPQSVEEDLPPIKEEPNFLHSIVEPQVQLCTDEYILGLGDRQDETSLSSSEANMGEVLWNVETVPDSPIMSKTVSLKNELDHFNFVEGYSIGPKIENHEIVGNSLKYCSRHSHIENVSSNQSGKVDLISDECIKCVPNVQDKMCLNTTSKKKSYTCDECGKCFTRAENLKSHIQIHTGVRNYKCDECGMCFARNNTLKRHILVHTGERNYKCMECGKCFTHSNTLKQHLLIHSGEKNYKCDECGKCFALRNSLNNHKIIHSGERNYKCSECSKCFTIKDNLIKHIRIHTGERNYKCIECGNCFTQSNSLKKHLLIHSVERNYKCDECGMCFSRQNTLKSHILIHTGERNYKCVQCSKCFTRKDNLKKHVRIHNGE